MLIELNIFLIISFFIRHTKFDGTSFFFRIHQLYKYKHLTIMLKGLFLNFSALDETETTTKIIIAITVSVLLLAVACVICIAGYCISLRRRKQVEKEHGKFHSLTFAIVTTSDESTGM